MDVGSFWGEIGKNGLRFCFGSRGKKKMKLRFENLNLSIYPWQMFCKFFSVTYGMLYDITLSFFREWVYIGQYLKAWTCMLGAFNLLYACLEFHIVY